MPADPVQQSSLHARIRKKVTAEGEHAACLRKAAKGEKRGGVSGRWQCAYYTARAQLFAELIALREQATR